MTSRVSFSAEFLRPFIRLVCLVRAIVRRCCETRINLKTACQADLLKLILVALINIVAFLNFYNEFVDERTLVSKFYFSR